jgi:hypothetical protein
MVVYLYNKQCWFACFFCFFCLFAGGFVSHSFITLLTTPSLFLEIIRFETPVKSLRSLMHGCLPPRRNQAVP